MTDNEGNVLLLVLMFCGIVMCCLLWDMDKQLDRTDAVIDGVRMMEGRR